MKINAPRSLKRHGYVLELAVWTPVGVPRLELGTSRIRTVYLSSMKLSPKYWLYKLKRL